MVRATFVMEQHLGHQTYYQNIRRFVEASPLIQSNWVPVTYTDEHSLWQRIPALPANLRGTLTGRSQVQQGLAQNLSDVAFFNTQVPAVLGGQFTRRQPYTISTDLTPIQYDQVAVQYGHRPDRPGPLANYKHRANTAILRGATRLFPWSTWARNSLISDYGVDPEKIEVLPPGVDLSSWLPNQQTHNEQLRILFVGGDFQRKGGDLLLKAFRALAPGRAELILVTKSRIATEPGVHVYNDLQPNAPTLRNLFQTSDVFVLPTAAEAFGIAAVEASAAGLPAIATNVGGLTDIVVEGENGFLFQPGDVQTLIDRLNVLAENVTLRTQMSRAARQRAEIHFNASRNATRLIDNLLTIAHKPPQLSI